MKEERDSEQASKWNPNFLAFGQGHPSHPGLTGIKPHGGGPHRERTCTALLVNKNLCIAAGREDDPPGSVSASCFREQAARCVHSHTSQVTVSSISMWDNDPTRVKGVLL